MRNCPEDHPSERALKLEVIQIYNKKLDERNKRKRLLRSSSFHCFLHAPVCFGLKEKETAHFEP